VPQPGPAPRFDRTPAATPTPAVEGVDPALVLESWGIDVATVDRLRATGILH
jgi:alpha-methylacyl-CoA racemase